MHTTRREFLARTGIFGGIGLLVAACAPAAPAPTPAPAANPTTPPKPAATTAPAEPAATTAPAAPAATTSAAVSAPTPATRAAAGPPTGELKVAIPAKVVALDPYGAQSVEEVLHTSIQHVLEPLVRRDPSTGNLVPNLATEWKNPDPTTWTFTLRNDVKYHDGSKLTSADVKAVLQRIQDQKGPIAPLFAQLDSVETPDETTAQIKTKAPVGTLLASMALVPIAPAAKVNEQGFFTKPIGTGPFKVVSWSADADLKLEANTDYWGSAPGLKNLTFRYYPEVAPMITALETGEVDFTWRLPPDQLPELQRSSDIKVETFPGYTYYFIWMNSSRQPFTDKRVRQAMAYALNVDKILADLLPGVAKRATAPIPSTVFGYAAQTSYAYDPNKAKQLLADAGLGSGFEAGTIWNPGSGPQDRELIQAMISDWSAIGVRVNTQEMERAVWIDNLTKLNWDMDFQTNAVTTGDADFTLGRLYHSRANRNGYKNPDLDKLLDEAASSVDQNQRKDLYAQANKIIWDDAAGIFPFELLNVYAYRKRVSSFVPSSSPILSFTTVTVA
jgi:peptide/nickel transport system substrate-binding protein